MIQLKRSLNLSFVFALVLSPSLVCAGLYPTQPVSDTTFHGGGWNEVLWKESGSSAGSTPSLDNLGRLSIDLFVDSYEATHIANLAQDVDPNQYRQVVYIPADVYENSSKFFIRFLSADPPASIWTADFTIDGMTGSAHSHNRTSSTSGQSSGGAEVPSVSSSNSGNSQNDGDAGKNGLVTVTMEMSGSAPSNTATAGGAVNSSADTRGSVLGAVSNDASASGGRLLASSRKMDLRFNFVFILFPGLLGLAMAL